MVTLEELHERVKTLEEDIRNIRDTWQVNEKLTVGDVDPKVIIEGGKVDGRDISEDGIVLDDNKIKVGEHDTKLGEHNNKLGEHYSNITANKSTITTVNNQLIAHSNNTQNPHGSTPAQIGAAKVNGDTNNDFKSKNLTATNKVSANEIIAKNLLQLGDVKVNIGQVNDPDATFTDSLNIVGGNLFFANDSSGWIGATDKIEHDLDGPGSSWLHIKGIEGQDSKRRIAIYGRTVIRDHSGLEIYGPVSIHQNLDGLKVNGPLRVSKNIKSDATIIGVIQNISTRKIKERISELESKYANNIINSVRPVKFLYKSDPRKEENLGFIAEEVPDILSDKDHKTVKIMDIVAALVKVVQEQQNEIEILKNSISSYNRLT